LCKHTAEATSSLRLSLLTHAHDDTETGRALASQTYFAASTNAGGSESAPAPASADTPSSPPNAPASGNKQHFVVFAMDRPGSLEMRMKTREAHLAFIKEQKGVMLAGPVMRSVDGAMCGSVLIVQGSRQDVVSMCNVDPYFTAGLFERVRVEEWKWVIGAGKEDAAQAADSLCLLECRDKPGSLEVRTANRDQHLEYLKSKGQMVLSAGPLLDDAGAMCGSVVILRATEAEAASFAQNDPYARAGLFEKVDIRRWKKVIDNRA
jgi:uncharacterized protein YciI